MKLTVDRNALMRSLAHVQAVVERRSTIPVLSNVLMVAETGRLRLTATDLDIEATDSANAAVVLEGRTTAPAQTLFDVVLTVLKLRSNWSRDGSIYVPAVQSFPCRPFRRMIFRSCLERLLPCPSRLTPES